MENLKEYIKVEKKDNTKASKFARIWNDPVWSKIISISILALLTTIFSVIESLFQGFNFYEFLTNVLFYKIPLYWFLIIIGISILIIVSINYYIKKRRLRPTDFIFNLKIGEFKYFELFNALNSHILPLPMSLKKTKYETISLLECFILYARKIVDGVSFDQLDNDQEQFLLYKVCPILEAYGLVIRQKEKNPKPNSNTDTNFYYISDNGRKFYQSIQVYRTYNGEINNEW